jgi:hypothetical protein
MMNLYKQNVLISKEIAARLFPLFPAGQSLKGVIFSEKAGNIPLRVTL